MKCPLCGAQLHWETVDGQYGKRMILICENGDFITGEGTATQCVQELQAAYDWNERNSK